MGMGGVATLVAPKLLGAPAFGQTPPAAPTGRVVVGLSQEPTVFNPLMPHIEVDDGVNFSVFDALFRDRPDGKASSSPTWRLRCPARTNGGISADGLQLARQAARRRPVARRQPFTAEDVKFTLELIVNPDFRAWRTTGHSLVRDITVVSPTELTWRMEEAFAPYLNVPDRNLHGAQAHPGAPRPISTRTPSIRRRSAPERSNGASALPAITSSWWPTPNISAKARISSS
jgi:peptide/nickel transport system substrate-binding protein